MTTKLMFILHCQSQASVTQRDPGEAGCACMIIPLAMGLKASRNPPQSPLLWMFTGSMFRSPPSLEVIDPAPFDSPVLNCICTKLFIFHVSSLLAPSSLYCVLSSSLFVFNTIYEGSIKFCSSLNRLVDEVEIFAHVILLFVLLTHLSHVCIFVVFRQL